jgi:PAS domain S-box-containing protein
MSNIKKLKNASEKMTPYQSPYAIVIILSLVIFLCEIIVMVVLPVFFDTHHTLSEIFFDGFFLLILLLPALYFLLLRPTLKQLAKRREMEAILENSQQNLERVVKKKTFDLLQTNEALQKKIQEFQQVEASLHESQEQYIRLIETLTDAIISVDETGKIIQWNDAASDIFGYSKSEIMYQSVVMLIPENYIKSHLEGFDRFVKTGKMSVVSKTISLEGLAKNGTKLPIELSISAFQKEETWIITAIIREISDRIAAENEIIRSRDTQKVINELLRASVTEQPVEWILENCLDLILSIKWLTAEQKGCIFLVEDKKDILIMKGQKGLNKELEAKCAEMPFGKCICGRAALSAKVEFAAKIDERHDIYLKRGMDDHGHYCIPILSESETLGVINIYLEAGHSYDETEVEFLSAVANTLAGILMRRYAKKEKQQIEMKLQHTQQLESIGTLAGGIAHDFNNILFPIVGYTQMLLEDTPEDSYTRDSLKQIYTSALRAKGLVKQILTFSRQESRELMLMKIQPIVKEALKLIRATIPTTIEIKQDMNPDCGVIKADPTQIHQIVMNLATNAYHAMEETGGELKVSLKEMEFKTLDQINPNMAPGIYACLIIADTGVGMEKKLTDKIFDPFFTTKAIGKGTGMGLSVVHGIVTAMGGAIQVYSEPEKGTQFHVFFPIEEDSFEKQNIQTKTLIQGGTEQILLVDDEKAILTMGKRMLERLGYQVTSHTGSLEALEAFRANPNKFDLVITDMAMPNMPGDKLSTELTKIRPAIPVLLCTGFSENISEERAASLGIKGFLLKPILMNDLAQKIREVLDENEN